MDMKLELEQDEFNLARIVCDKMALRLQGLLSVGLPLLTSEVHSLPPFLEDQLSVLKSFAIVLRSVTVGKEAGARQWKRLTAELGNQLDQLEQHAAQVPQLLAASTADPFGRTRITFSDICAHLQSCFDLLRLESPHLAEAKLLAEQIFDHLVDLHSGRRTQPSLP